MAPLFHLSYETLKCCLEQGWATRGYPNAVEVQLLLSVDHWFCCLGLMEVATSAGPQLAKSRLRPKGIGFSSLLLGAGVKLKGERVYKFPNV